MELYKQQKDYSDEKEHCILDKKAKRGILESL